MRRALGQRPTEAHTKYTRHTGENSTRDQPVRAYLADAQNETLKLLKLSRAVNHH